MSQNPNEFVGFDALLDTPAQHRTGNLSAVGQEPAEQSAATSETPEGSAWNQPTKSGEERAVAVSGPEERSPQPTADGAPGASVPEVTQARQAEASDALTPERVLPKRHRVPESGWRLFLYKISAGTINIGDSADVVERHDLESRITARLPEAGMRSVAVVSGKGGVGKTTMTALIGMSMASLRHDRAVAVDANPDKASLALRIDRQTSATVWDVVGSAGTVESFSDMSRLVSRDATRLDVIVSANESKRSRPFGGSEYQAVADLLSVYYSVMLTDTGTDLTHNVYPAVLDRADCIVLVARTKFDEARIASETLDDIVAMGYGHLVENAVVALVETANPRVDVNALAEHFATRVGTVVRIPHDDTLDAGSRIVLSELHSSTRRAALKLAAAVTDRLTHPTR